MTDDEWKACCYLMEQAWKGEMPAEKMAAYRVFLDKFTPEEVTAALQRLTEHGPPFLPAVPEIVQEIRRMQEPPVPSWSEAWAALQRALPKRTQSEAVALLDEIHPILSAFMRVEGYEALRMTEFFDPDYGGARVEQLRKRWVEFIEAAQDRVFTARALGNGEAAGPRRLDASAVLGLKLPKPKELPPGAA